MATPYDRSYVADACMQLEANWPAITVDFIYEFVNENINTMVYTTQDVRNLAQRLINRHGMPAGELTHIMRTPHWNLAARLFRTLADGTRYVRDYLMNRFEVFGQDRDEHIRVWMQDYVRLMLEVPNSYDYMVANPDALDRWLPNCLEAPRHLPPLCEEDESDEEEETKEETEARVRDEPEEPLLRAARLTYPAVRGNAFLEAYAADWIRLGVEQGRVLPTQDDFMNDAGAMLGMPQLPDFGPPPQLVRAESMDFPPDMPPLARAMALASGVMPVRRRGDPRRQLIFDEVDSDADTEPLPDDDMEEDSSDEEEDLPRQQ